MYKNFFKRCLDIAFSLLFLLALGWVIAALAVVVRVKLGTPVIFKQDRPGKDGKVFTLYKFRSMSDACDENGELLPDAKRLTKFGRLLRESSLDELPEVWNILKGDMSLVGPRPLAVQYLPYYTAEERKRHDVRPGLTGWAQVNGRNALSWERKFSYDLEYIKNISLLFDIKIIFLTVKKVLVREGIGQAEEAPTSLHIERQKKEEQIV